VRLVPVPAARILPPLLSGGEALLEGSILGLPGPINEKPTDQTCSRTGDSSQPGVPADRPGDSADAGAGSGAGHRALLGWRHIGASSNRQGDGGEQQ